MKIQNDTSGNPTNLIADIRTREAGTEETDVDDAIVTTLNTKDPRERRKKKERKKERNSPGVTPFPDRVGSSCCSKVVTTSTHSPHRKNDSKSI